MVDYFLSVEQLVGVQKWGSKAVLQWGGGRFFAATLYPKSCVHPCFKLKHLPSFAHPQVFPVQQEALLPPPLLADSETKEIAKRNM